MRLVAFLAGALATGLVLLGAHPGGRSADAGAGIEAPEIAFAKESDEQMEMRAATRSNVALRVQRFRDELRAFAADLERTGRVDRRRARELATIAVGEAYRHGIPPALVLGVMLVENAEFKSTARSSAGAVGLMQVMPSVWKEPLGPRYGWDLTDDRINIAMGVHVLAHYYQQTNRDWQRALLRYNGCVRGTRTPNCFEYPNWVRRQTERHARSLCANQGFDGCVTRRLFAEFNPSVVGSN